MLLGGSCDYRLGCSVECGMRFHGGGSGLPLKVCAHSFQLKMTSVQNPPHGEPHLTLEPTPEQGGGEGRRSPYATSGTLGVGHSAPQRKTLRHIKDAWCWWLGTSSPWTLCEGDPFVFAEHSYSCVS